MTEEVYVGIDPGLKGAIAVIAGDLVIIDDMPDAANALDMLKRDNVFECKTALEQVHPLPGQSCIASFTYGGAYMLAYLLAKHFSKEPVLVSPQKWKKFYDLKRLPGETKTAYKRRSVDKARELFPQATELLKYSKDGRAEALLIANWLRASDNS